jgi:hypothetical protein
MVSRWTGYVSGVYPLYDVYDNLPVLAYSSRKLNSFLRMDALIDPHLIRSDEQRNGGAGRDRTDDLKLAKLPLSQLSYSPIVSALPRNTRVVGLGRFELPTSPLSRARSNQLSYRPVRAPLI